jgi:hypothetical protein
MRVVHHGQGFGYAALGVASVHDSVNRFGQGAYRAILPSAVS